MNNLIGIAILAVVLEGTITYVNTWVVDRKIQWQQITSCALGVGIAVVYEVDLLAQFGVTSSLPYVGAVITGIALSRGSNYVFDLIERLQGHKKEMTVKDYLQENDKG